MKSVELKKTIMQHNNLASAVMNTKHDTRENTLFAYKNFIDSNEIVSQILLPIKTASIDAQDLFEKNGNDIEMNRDSNEIRDKAILYKHLTFMVESDKLLYVYAHSIFWTEKTFNACIQRLMDTSVRPIIDYVRLKLEEMFVEAEHEEKMATASSIHNGDNFYGVNVQKVEHGQASMNNVGNDIASKKFVIQKESFWLGVLSAVLSGLIIWGIEELICYLLTL